MYQHLVHDSECISIVSFREYMKVVLCIVNVSELCRIVNVSALCSTAKIQVRPRGYKTFFMFNSAKHEICPANKSQITDNCKFFLAKHS